MLCRIRLASAYRAGGRLADAIQAAEQTSAACERLLSTDDPEGISCRSTLGAIYSYAGRVAEAAPLLERARSDFLRVLGPDHPETIRTRLGLASNLYRSGDFEAAISEY
jgi:tetratricopeptide (TPR) repeat protein